MAIFNIKDIPPHLHQYFKSASEIGLEQTPEAYVAALVEVFREVRRVLRDDGVLWLNLGDSYTGYHGNSKVPDHEAPSNKPEYIEERELCACKMNPLLAYFSTAEQALVQAILPTLQPREREAVLSSVRLAMQAEAKREIDTFCAVCQRRHDEHPGASSRCSSGGKNFAM